MKKGFYAILAMLTVFALVMTSCDNGSSSSKPATTKYDVTFDYNYTGSPAAAVVQVEEGQTATAPDNPTRSSYKFIGWFSVPAETGGDEFDPTAAVTANAKYYARWEISFSVTYNANGGTGTNTKEESQSSFTIPSIGDVSVYRADSIFQAWNTAANGSGTAYAPGQVITLTGDITLFAQWKAVTSLTPPTAEIVEELSLGNGWFATYKFTLPSGKTWKDYKNGGLVAYYKLSQDVIDNGVGRAIRVMGNFFDKEATGPSYTSAAIIPGDTSAAQANNIELSEGGPLIDFYNGIQLATVGQWVGGRTGGTGLYILSHMGGSYDGKMGDELAKIGPVPEADQWFPVVYIIDGSKKNSAYDARRMPSDSATGPFYFAVGLPGQNSANVFQVKNVTLVGTTDGTADVVGMPLYYKNTHSSAGTGTAALFRAYNGQFFKDGTNGTSEATWNIISGSENIVPIERSFAQSKVVQITFNYGTGDPAKIFKVLINEKLTSGQLAPPERAGFQFLGWFDAATGGNKIEPLDTTDKTKGTAFTANNTNIFAQWKSVTPNMTPWVINNPTILLFKGAVGTPSTLNDDGSITMMSGTKNGQAGRSGEASLIGFSLDPTDLATLTGCPADVLDGFTKIKVEWEATWVAGPGPMSVVIKSGLNTYDNPPTALTPPGYNQYPDLGAANDPTASGYWDWPISLFSAPTNASATKGLGLQINDNPDPNAQYPHPDEYKLKITKITFYYEE